MSEKEKLKAYLKHKRISKNAFCLSLGFAQKFLDSGKSLGVDKLREIKQQYPDLSLDWMVLDREPMIDSRKDNIAQFITSGDAENTGEVLDIIKQLNNLRSNFSTHSVDDQEVLRIADRLLEQFTKLSEKHQRLVNFVKSEYRRN